MTKPVITSNEPVFVVNGVAVGLTKREHFAAMAMQGIVNHEMTYGIYNKPETKETWRESHTKEIAWYAIEMADALIEELNK